MANKSFASAIRRCFPVSSILGGAAMALLIVMPADAAQQPESVRSPDATARYEAGLKAARKLLEAYNKQEQTPVRPEFDNLYKVEDEFFESLKVNGKEGVEAAELVAQRNLPFRKDGRAQRIWMQLTRYLTEPGFAWGRSHLNSLLRSEKVSLLTRTRMLVQVATIGTEPANWLDDEAVLTIVRLLLTNTDHYATRGLLRDGNPPQQFEFEMRFCDLGVQLVCNIYMPDKIKWIDAGTPLSQAEADRQRNENVEAAKRWIEARLARLAARKELLEIASSYWRLNLAPGQTATVLDLWAGLETRNASGNIRDLNALANMLLADLKRTGDKPREGIEKDFHRAVHGRLASILGKAGFKPEGAENNQPANFNEEREWLRNAVGKLARGACPDQWMRYEWQKYYEELKEAVLADIKTTESSPSGSDDSTGKKSQPKSPVSVPRNNSASP